MASELPFFPPTESLLFPHWRHRNDEQVYYTICAVLTAGYWMCSKTYCLFILLLNNGSMFAKLWRISCFLVLTAWNMASWYLPFLIFYNFQRTEKTLSCTNGCHNKYGQIEAAVNKIVPATPLCRILLFLIFFPFMLFMGRWV